MKIVRALLLTLSFAAGSLGATSIASACDGKCNCQGGKACEHKDCNHNSCPHKDADGKGNKPPEKKPDAPTKG